MDIPEIGAHLLSTAELRATGRTRASIEADLREGRLVRVHRGWYMDAAYWATLYSEGRQVAQGLAVFGAARSERAIASHTTAAAFLLLPIARISPKKVHLVSARANGRVASDRLVARHRADLTASDVTTRFGVSVTSLMRTVCDLIGHLPLESAVSLADAAMRSVAWREDTRTYDAVAAELWRTEMREHLARRGGARGIVQARWVLEFADGRAQRPGESISRLYLERLGFGRPRLQVPVTGPNGEEWVIDLGLDDVPAWGEFDGQAKYTDPQMLAGQSTAAAVLAEKAREDWIRGTTGRPVLRWGWSHIASPASFRRHLAAFGVTAPVPHLRIHFEMPRSTF
ncbi:hypothetical protein DEA06_12375 [Microbacterium sp. Gd 4-13]|uniref:hypothetical protein n=1 Tax=Microbacterium sp. Gd 4-13 TaxID=2173179 RepID=UPI000D580A61|nr:hypothetical protein [Microbacterium sp. Gd 4-13]PVW03665.1 hypothetical protein DEA06_12375 [Microbacterium sp. Gd 4-13]